jgi:hypothetical protein
MKHKYLTSSKTAVVLQVVQHRLMVIACAMSLSGGGVITEMDVLLTGGRLEPANGAIIKNAYVRIAARRDVSRQIAHAAALRRAQQLFAMTPEFRITNHLRDDSASACWVR